MTQHLSQLTPPLLSGLCVEEKRRELKVYFQQTCSTYESLFSLINADEAYFLRPEPLRHPLIFYFGHTATFYINKLILGKFINKRINQKLEAICAVGVDEMSWDDLNSAHYDWPSVDEVREYRLQVFKLIEKLIDTMELSLPIQQNSLAWLILMGCEHERIHLETSSVIMRMLPLSCLTQSSAWQSCPFTSSAPLNEFLSVAQQDITLGKPESDETFGWDNEYGSTNVTVMTFKASKYLISNQEYLAFVQAGGYTSPEFWSDEGQQWLAFKKATMPRFWQIDTTSHSNNEVSYVQRNLLNEIPLPLDWPVEVNYLEAKAFCNWQSSVHSMYIRLPTEAEWLVLRNKISSDLPQWHEAPGNTNLEYFSSSCPVNRFETDGFFDVLGNVWQWTESAIDGFDDFKVHPLYDDFSTPTFDGRHNLLKGGSWISTGNEALKHSRYAFRRHFMQHAGFRTVMSDVAEIPTLEVNLYETNPEVCQQLESHYGDNYLAITNYPQRISNAVMQYVEQCKITPDKLLDLGCSVGRCSFELAKYFEQVDGIDFSAGIIQHGVQLQKNNRVKYVLEQEGEIVDFKEVELTSLALNESSNKVDFYQGDASNLKNIYKKYNVIVAQHVLESTYHPTLFLKTVQQRLKADGLLIIVSNYQFSEKITEKSEWLTGIKVNGENVCGIDGLSPFLSEYFNLIGQQDLTRVLRENQRNFQVSHCQLTAWQLKA
ncbi:MAG: 5-histidylcysteine sulfoxide synthase [Colwellia sp.]|nr:5-histidylcysteine sulfoxide synthase [Colwellia sp.]